MIIRWRCVRLSVSRKSEKQRIATLRHNLFSLVYYDSSSDLYRVRHRRMFDPPETLIDRSHTGPRPLNAMDAAMSTEGEDGCFGGRTHLPERTTSSATRI